MNEKYKPHNLEQAQEDVEILRKKVETVETLNVAEAEKQLTIQKIELTTEVIEMIIGKIEDINVQGTAFHVLAALEKWHGEKKPVTETETISDVLRSGILGQNEEHRHKRQGSAEASLSRNGAYVEDIKRRKLPRVWFDIVGRGPESIARAFWMRGRVSVAIVFDLTKFTDGIGREDDFEQRLKEIEESGSMNPEADYIQQHSKIGVFFPASASGPTSPLGWNEIGLTDGSEDCGHVLLGRVPPRYFEGIVLRVRRIGEDGRYSKDELDQTKIQNEVDKIIDAQFKIYGQKPEMLLPVYDAGGNLLWPKQMRYNDLKKFIVDKESKSGVGSDAS